MAFEATGCVWWKTRGGSTQRGSPSTFPRPRGFWNASTSASILHWASAKRETEKRTGFRAHFAAAVEAVASTGGQIMPPVMGAAAFVMAEFLGVAYITIAKHAAPQSAALSCWMIGFTVWQRPSVIAAALGTLVVGGAVYGWLERR